MNTNSKASSRVGDANRVAVRIVTLASGALLLALSAACSSDLTESSEDALSDSFAHPTEHGGLRFGDASDSATFSDRERFHAWTFTLTDAATVKLKTSAGFGSNLDTQMYLYRRNVGTSSWGNHVAMNDDSGGTLDSFLQQGLTAGEYHVVIKAKKIALKGSFALSGTCTGKGCPTANASCVSSKSLSLPKETALTKSCTAKINAVIGKAIVSKSDTKIMLSKKCQLSELERKSVDYYRAYWEKTVGWRDFTKADEDTKDWEIFVHTENRGSAGTLIKIDIAADESAIKFVYDANGKLLFYFQVNETPAWGWFCGEANETPIKETSAIEYCVRDAFLNNDASGKSKLACP